jgi:uncharacterized protein (DUF1499 family)
MTITFFHTYQILLLFFLIGVSSSLYNPAIKPSKQFFSTALLQSSNTQNSELSTNISDKIIKIISVFKPLIGFYALMLAPLYGIGLPLWFGSMTDFSTLQNRGLPGTIANEYIVAPYDYTPARINQIAPEYNIPPDELKNEINKIVMRQPRIRFIASDYEKTKRIEYVQRTLIFRFPDVITFQIIPLNNDKKSTFAVHSYSVYGASDLGVNGNRIKSWIHELNDDIDALVASRGK